MTGNLRIVTLLVLSVFLLNGCSNESAPSGDSSAGNETPADPAAAFQNLADTIVRVMNADGRMQGELTVVEAAFQPDAVSTQPGAAVGTIVLAYQSKDVEPAFACRVTLTMENAIGSWDFDPQGRRMSDYESPLQSGSADAFNRQVGQHTDVIRNVMDDHWFKSEIMKAVVAPKP
ncbi:MAG: hypothetical protein HND58_06825 [Planctomycetota bacterium]|nr:MAG: hypothetical protein HND58_06825 [Planctomycetota bacterium]